MQRVLAMVWLTLKAAVRSRLIWVLTVILIGGVVVLPLVIKDDGTARGFTQILVTYTLSLTTAMLGFATLWLACGTLARDVEECQIQVVAVKPISRWQIWLGKFFGIMALNAILLVLAGTCIYTLLQWRSRRLPEAQQEILRNEVMVARGSARDDSAPNYNQEGDRIFAERIRAQERENKAPVTEADAELLRKQIRAQVKAANEIVPPGHRREWNVKLGSAARRLQDQPIYLRVKFNSAQPAESGTFLGLWMIGDFNSPRPYQHEAMSLAPETYHEFKLPPNLFDK